MKMVLFGLIAGLLLYILALVPGVLPHRADVLFMILGGVLIASFSILGFDIPFPGKKLYVSLLLIGGLVLFGGVLMAIIGHQRLLFIITAPALGLVLFGSRQLAIQECDQTSQLFCGDKRPRRKS